MRQRSVSGAAIDRLEESCSFQNVNRLRYLRLNKLPFPRRYDSLVFGGLVIHRGLALPILILIYQKIPPRMSQNYFPNPVRKSQLRKSLNIYIDLEITGLLDTKEKLQVNACSVGQRREERNCAGS